MIDPVLICIYCGDLMNKPTDNQIKVFGSSALECCGYDMLTIDRNNLHDISKGIDKLKESVNEEIIRGIV